MNDEGNNPEYLKVSTHMAPAASSNAPRLTANTASHAVAIASVDANRSAIIDFLRGICVLLVVLDHIDLRFRIKRFDVDGLLPDPIRQVLFHSGYFAVITFFVISGFLITTLSRRRWVSLGKVDVVLFYWLRFARIVPCLLMLVALLSVLHLAQVPEFVIRRERGTLGQAILAALTFHVNWLEGRQGYLPGAWDILWSLSVEEVFYLAFPLVCLLCRRERWIFVPLIVLIVIGPLNRAALTGQDPWSEYAYLSCADGIAFGCLAALLGGRMQVGALMARSSMALGITCVLLVVVFRDTAADLGIPGREYGVTVLELGLALILFSTAQGVGRSVSLAGTGLIQTVGRGSYEIYLTHMLVVLGLIPLIVELKPDTSIATWYVALLLLSVVLGLTFQKIYSEPLNRFLRSRRAAGKVTG